MPYPRQIDDAERRVAATLHLAISDLGETAVSTESGFRNKAKMAVSGSITQPLLGIIDADTSGTDLSHCPLYPAPMHRMLDILNQFITTARLEPYSIATRTGELKHLLVTISPDEEFMVRFVLRSTEAVARIKKHLPQLLLAAPEIAVATVNVLPAHKAALEGDHEIFLTDQSSLPMRLRDVTLHLRPRSFFQTNTAMAQTLYDQAVALTEHVEAALVWDLYCGVGGFALHLAPVVGHVEGVEVSMDAVESAAISAAAAGLDNATFIAADATKFAAAQLAQGVRPDLVVVNPPRRGLGDELAQLLDHSGIETLLYSSCNPASLARDLANLSSYEIHHVEVLDMFPHTEHNEVLTLLSRKHPSD